MKVLHCSWIPEPGDAFIQAGDFWLWVEDQGPGDGRPASHGPCPRHPRHLAKAALIEFFEDMLGLTVSAYERRFHFSPQRLHLPTVGGQPLPAPEFEHGVDEHLPPAPLALW